MSHFVVLVVGDVDSQLAPFCESDEAYMTAEDQDSDDGESYNYNPNAKWDWYEVGGRWEGALLHKNGERVSELRKSELDIAGMQRQSVDRALGLFDAYADAFRGQEIPTWNATLSQCMGDSRAASEAYDLDPVIAAINALRAAYKGLEAPYADLPWSTPCRHELFCGGDREAMAAKAAQDAGVLYAFLRDGEWYEGNGSWFKEDSLWSAQYHSLLADVPDDTLLTVVDCHI